MNKLAGLLLVTMLAGCGDKNGATSKEFGLSPNAKADIGILHGATLPPGMKRKGWMGLDSIHGHDYGLSAVAKGRQRTLWLDRDSVTPAGPGWAVVAAMGWDSMPHGYEVQLGQCASGEMKPNEIIALIYRAAPKAAAEVRHAWHVNRATESFDELKPSNVVCR